MIDAIILITNRINNKKDHFTINKQPLELRLRILLEILKKCLRIITDDPVDSHLN